MVQGQKNFVIVLKSRTMEGHNDDKIVVPFRLEGVYFDVSSEYDYALNGAVLYGRFHYTAMVRREKEW